MLLFLIKKTFFDMWDHLLSIFLLNFGAILLLGGVFYLIQFLVGIHPLLFWLAVVLGGLIFCLYIGILSSFMGDIADFKALELQKFLPYLKEVWPVALLFAGYLGLQVVFAFAIFWYSSLGNFFGVAVAGTLFWAGLIAALSSQYLFPLWKQATGKLKAMPSKCLLLFFDNSFFTIFLAFGALILLILSSLTAFLFPGIATVFLWYQVGLRFRMYKYEYLGAHPNVSRKRIPWQELVAEDRDRVGPRSFKGMVFPWKV